VPLLIIVNNTAAKARNAWPLIRARLAAEKVSFTPYETTCAGDATVRTRAALKEGYDLIGVVGGDGTLSEVAEGLFDFTSSVLPMPISSSAALAVLPAGTGDDYARGVMGRRAKLEQWLQLLVDYCHQQASVALRVVDLLAATCDDRARQFVCLNAATMGIGGETGARVAAQGNLMRMFSGEVRFVVAAIGALAAWRERRVRITIDEEKVIDAPMNLVAIANGLYAGGGMMLSPDARIDDGKLDVVTASGLNRVQVLRELPRIHSGGHVTNPKVRIVQGSRVRVETFSAADALLIEADGNVRGRTPAEFRIMPRALRVVAPRQVR
jgi:YegS/Rv2252/BmrU family lipid kinase